MKKNSGAGRTFRRLLTYLSPYMPLFLFSLLLSAAAVVLTLYFPILTGRAVDLLIGGGEVDFTALFNILLSATVLVPVTALLQWMANLCSNRMTYGIVRDLRRDAFSHIEQLPLSYIDSHSHGDILSRVIADADSCSDGLLMGFTQLFTGVVTILGTLVFMLSIHAGIALVVVILTPLSLFAASYIAKKTFSMFLLQSQTRGEQTALVQEMLQNQKSVQAFSYEPEALRRFDDTNNRLREASQQAVFFSSLTNPVTRFVNSVVYAAVGVTGACLAIGGGITVGGLSCFLTYANQYTKPFNDISGVITELQNAFACAGRIFDLMEERPQTHDAPDAFDLPSPKGQLTINDVSFSYTKEQHLIEHFNLSVPVGAHVAIVGPTGCGKTTLINLLMRFYDVDEGDILLDGRSIYQLTRESLRSSYGMVLQETFIFAGTVRDNLCMGRKDISEERMKEAAKAAHAHEFILQLPQGYDTQLSNEGGVLSRGQRQLLCIARVMLLEPPMLILDEATSSIDTRTEVLIQDSFLSMMENKTAFIVAHRLSTIRDADMILVMSDGKIVEQGTHESLLRQDGFYASLYNSQFC